MKAHRILVVDDEPAARAGIRKALETRGYKVSEAGAVAEAQKLIEGEAPDLVLLDLNLGGEDGMDLLRSLRGRSELPLVVIITAHVSEKLAVEAIKTGAYDYIAKPFEVEELRQIVRNAMDSLTLRYENEALKRQLEQVTGYGEMLGQSSAMSHVFDLIERVADTDVTVLISGESGSGKELVAREIHRRSPRSAKPLITLNCAALPETLIESELFGHERGAFTGASDRRKGKFESAHGGSLFLDEIGDMAAETQAKVLRAIEQQTIERLGGTTSIPVNVRILSATHKDLEREVREGRFREDLYYRLKVVTIPTPPLRQRREDIPLLLAHFLAHFAEKHRRPAVQVEPEAMQSLLEYNYPGNVRELRNMAEQLVVLARADRISSADLPAAVRQYEPAEAAGSANDLAPFFQLDFKEARQLFEKIYLAEKLRSYRNNISRTAAAIGLHRQSLQQKIRELGITSEPRTTEPRTK